MFDRKEYMKEYSAEYRKEHREYDKEYYSIHRNRIKAQSAQYYLEHRERIKQDRKEYYKKHREKEKEYNKAYSLAHLEYKKEYDKQRYINDRSNILEKIRQQRESNPEKYKENELKSNYDLSYKDWLAMWNIQNGKCAICGELFENSSDACVDHDHETGKVRGLLCMKCNLGLGLFRNSLDIVKNVIDYLNNKKGGK